MISQNPNQCGLATTGWASKQDHPLRVGIKVIGGGASFREFVLIENICHCFDFVVMIFMKNDWIPRFQPRENISVKFLFG